jgi:uncharacterized protein (DUF1501 family)
MKRRSFLASSTLPWISGLGGVSLLTGSHSGLAAAEDYRAMVCLYLNGGNDGNNTLVPTDGAYSDYSTARPDLALAKSSLVGLAGQSAGHAFGLHPALSPLADLYNQERLAWIANTGPLIVPATAQQVMDRAVPIPSFLMSHSDQTAMQQGWGGDADTSGWAGRALEKLPSALINPLNAVTMDSNRTLVLGQSSTVSFLNQGGVQYWGSANLAQASDYWTQTLNNMARWQFGNRYEAEYASTLNSSLADSTVITSALARSTSPTGNFGSDELSQKLKTLATVLPVFKAMGYRRQIFLVTWGSFDTHYEQMGTADRTQDSQLAVVAKALAAFDTSNVDAGLDLNVTTLMMSEFGRTLRPASGGGSDHAWGNHWFALGGAVAGRQVLGQFPSLVLGGPDDSDPGRGGRMVPSTATDQVGATLMQWMGLSSDQLTAVFPNLVNFSSKTLPLFKS